MPLYVITYDHPDEAAWARWLMPHVEWLQARLKDKTLLASGPFEDTSCKSAMLILSAPDMESVEALIATDPFAIHGLIENMTVHEWDPIFGAFNPRSSRPGQLQGD